MLTIAMKTFGPVEENARVQLERCQQAEEGSAAVLCADHHLGYSMPIGGVIGYEGLISPSAVGYDIGCGNMAVRTDVQANEIDVAKAMDDIWRSISFGVGLKNQERNDDPVIDAIADSPVPFQRGLASLAAQQLGTVGSGNHYVDLFEDRADGRLWVGVHFGSRGFGHKTATWALEQAGAPKNDAMDAPPVVIPLHSPLGGDYYRAMELAGQYAYAGREWVVGKVLRIIGARAIETVHNHHNYAWQENHKGAHGNWRTLMVHRKGATPAFPGQRGFVGGTMGDDAVILMGVAGPESAAALYSTVHGAGRARGRNDAVRGRHEWRCLAPVCSRYNAPQDASKGGRCSACYRPLEKVTTRPPVNFRDWQHRIKAQGIELRGAGADETPECYKVLSDVLAYHGDTIRVLNRLKPLGVAMAGKETHDPYRD